MPARKEVEMDHMESAVTNAAEPGKLCLEEAPGYARLGNMLAELDIDQIDLLPNFRETNRQDGIRLFRQGSGDRHWNPEGHALAAEIVLSELIEMGLFSYPDE